MGFLTLLLALQAAGQVFDMGTNADRLVVLEAESGTVFNANGKTWTVINATSVPPLPTANSSAVGTAMACLPNDGTGGNDSATGFVNGPRLSFRCLFRQAGTYHVWVRGRAIDGSTATPVQAPGNNDSCHVGLNGVPAVEGYRVVSFPATDWDWSRSRDPSPNTATLNVPTVGVHTFFVYMREDGFMIDRILITANNGYTGVTQGGNMNGPTASGQIADMTPAAATAPVLTPGSFSIGVSWAAVANADTYILERAEGAGAFVQIFSGTARTFNDPVFQTDRDFCYRVRGVDNVFGSGPVSPASCARAQLPPSRTADHSEGFFDENCACGSTASGWPAAAWILVPLLLLFRRR